MLQPTTPGGTEIWIVTVAMVVRGGYVSVGPRDSRSREVAPASRRKRLMALAKDQCNLATFGQLRGKAWRSACV